MGKDMKRMKSCYFVLAAMLAFSGCSPKNEDSKVSQASVSETTETVEKSVSEEFSTEAEETVMTTDTTSSSASEAEDDSGMIDKKEIDQTGEKRAYLKNACTDEIIEIDDFTSSTNSYFVMNNFQYDNNAWSEAFDIGRDYPKYAEGDDLLNITKDLDMPAKVDDFTVIWESSDETIIQPDGTVTCPHDHSRYVLLTAIITKENRTVISRKVVRVARDTYADVTTDKILRADMYHDPAAFQYEGIDESFIGHWFYELEDPEQFYLFDNAAGRIYFTDEMRGKTRQIQLDGILSEVHIETINEACLQVYASRKALGLQDWCELRYDRVSSGLGDIAYDFAQYYQDVPVHGGVRLMIYDENPNQFMNSWLLQIPEGFDANPKFSKDEAIQKYDLYEDKITLEILELNNEIHLIWNGYVKNKMEYVYIDAQTGEELQRDSTFVT